MGVDPANVSFGLAFVAGLASFISPCVLSLVPAYISYLSSRAVVTTSGHTSANRWVTLSHGLAFVLGFSVVFVLLGMAASAIGNLLFDLREPLTRIGGVVVIVFGLHTMGVIHLPFLDYDTRRQQAPDARLGYLSSALMGVFFSAGWAPCVGPIYGAVLTMAFTTTGVNRAGVLLIAYSLGLGIPFLLAAAGLGNVSGFLKRYGRHLRWVSIATGIFLVIIGLLLLSGVYSGTMARLANLPLFTDIQNRLDQWLIDFWGGEG